MSDGTPQKASSSKIEALFKIALMAIVSFMGWQQKSMTDEISAARVERVDSDERNRKEREQLTAWALGISTKIDTTAKVVSEVKKDAAAAKVAATTLKADVANVQKSVGEVKKSVAEIQ